MEPTNEFQDFGKKLPYREPAGFFEQFSERTLQQAKLRERSRRKSLVLWRTVAVAASLSALAMLGYFAFEPEKPELQQIVEVKQPVEQLQRANQELTKQAEVAEIKKTVQEKTSPTIVTEESNTEEISDVLADLTDDELFQLAAMYKADAFISESEQ